MGIIQSLFLLIGKKSLHLADIGLIRNGSTAKISLRLAGLSMAVEQMALIGMGTNDLSVLRKLEALFCAGMSLNLRHNSPSLK